MGLKLLFAAHTSWHLPLKKYGGGVVCLGGFGPLSLCRFVVPPLGLLSQESFAEKYRTLTVVACNARTVDVEGVAGPTVFRGFRGFRPREAKRSWGDNERERRHEGEATREFPSLFFGFGTYK